MTLPPKRPERLCASMISRTKLEGRVSSVMGPIVSPRVRLGARLFPDRTEEALHGRHDGGQDHDREGEDEEPVASGRVKRISKWPWERRRDWRKDSSAL